jgi:antirestriction protein ArdC
MPRNAGTGREYNGINVLLLALTQFERGFTHPLWVTFNQAKKLVGTEMLQRIGPGGQPLPGLVEHRKQVVNKGTKGTRVVLYKTAVKDKGKDTERRYSLLRSFTVFNIDQINLSDEERQALLEKRGMLVEHDPIGRHDECDATIDATGATITHGGSECYYSPKHDRVTLSERDSFHSMESYYATAFHELVHWTGAEKRLDRKLR